MPGRAGLDALELLGEADEELASAEPDRFIATRAAGRAPEDLGLDAAPESLSCGSQGLVEVSIVGAM